MLKLYKYENPNPDKKKTGDCGVRCIAVALNISWNDAYELLAYYGRKNHEAAGAMSNIEEILLDHGFIKMSVKLQKGKKRPTMKKLLREDPDRVIVGQTIHHVTAARNGRVLDIWDTTERPLYRYYVKKEIPCSRFSEVLDVGRSMGITITNYYDTVVMSVSTKHWEWNIPFVNVTMKFNDEYVKELSHRVHDFLYNAQMDYLAFGFYDKYMKSARRKLEDTPSMSLMDALYSTWYAMYRIRMFLRALDGYIEEKIGD